MFLRVFFQIDINIADKMQNFIFYRRIDNSARNTVDLPVLSFRVCRPIVCDFEKSYVIG